MALRGFEEDFLGFPEIVDEPVFQVDSLPRGE
jgi:hypothetical protein